MNSSQVRGYILQSAVSYLRKTAGDKSGQIIERLSPQARNSIETAREAMWCPSSHTSEVYRAIAAVRDNVEDRVRADLIECGNFTAREASTTFLRLVMKLLTPTMFAKKLPDLWLRDCTAGKITAEVQDTKIRNTFTDIEGFDHIAPVAVGFVTFALSNMGKKITKTDLQGWSIATPGPATFTLEVHWEN
ncbi:hypothetical protein AKJ09_04039 [Labilithrix luteola]|uniref:Uncharacterized protein n=1 Tax=Labilithrix luteola TaxID=1391654 RepID=A0A0K1PV17_9BACT|nr:hypothetical protein [Labilithrix luteola]AKU97375.1 hypothetical protein AKJ09_04039 [Labilithrix luteola]